MTPLNYGGTSPHSAKDGAQRAPVRYKPDPLRVSLPSPVGCPRIMVANVGSWVVVRSRVPLQLDCVPKIDPHHPGLRPGRTVSCGIDHASRGWTANAPWNQAVNRFGLEVSMSSPAPLYHALRRCRHRCSPPSWPPGALPGQPPSTPRPFEQTPAGFTAFHKQLRPPVSLPKPPWSCLKPPAATGLPLPSICTSAGYRRVPLPIRPTFTTMPSRCRAAARAIRLDTTLLTQFALERQPGAWTPPPAVYHELRQRLVARDGLLTMRQQARNQLHALEQWPVRVAAVQQQMSAGD